MIFGVRRSQIASSRVKFQQMTSNRPTWFKVDYDGLFLVTLLKYYKLIRETRLKYESQYLKTGYFSALCDPNYFEVSAISNSLSDHKKSLRKRISGDEYVRWNFLKDQDTSSSRLEQVNGDEQGKGLSSLPTPATRRDHVTHLFIFVGIFHKGYH